MPKNRLAVSSSTVGAGERHFALVDELKAELLSRKK